MTLIKSGWRPPYRIVETVEQLDALELDTIILEVSMADDPHNPADFSPEELARLDELGFIPGDDDSFRSFRFGSA